MYARARAIQAIPNIKQRNTNQNTNQITDTIR